MKFGQKYKDNPAAASGGGSGKWIKAFKEGETRMRFLQEMEDWVVYYEHYNPMGTAFPCTGDRSTCPGCTSSNERMKQASRKTAAVALVGQYVDVYKLPVKLVNRLSIRAERNGGTVTDRDYLVTRIGKDKDTEYDLESGNAAPVDISAYELPDIEKMLETSFRENWPDFEADQILEQVEEIKKVPEKSTETKVAESLVRHADGNTYSQNPPSEPAAQSEAGEQEITIEQLKTMTPEQLKKLCSDSGAEVPDDLTTQAEIIGWMEKQFA